ncbi:MAG TPA: NAD-dependent malic enzyme [Candidatus Limnocylindria bacterium]|nr:NAD-dependent malic enzyme [Candidatus Limnocylindria bacterium]
MRTLPVLTPAHRLIYRLEIANRPGMFARVAVAVGELGCSLGAIDLVEATPDVHVRDVTVDAPDEETGRRLTTALQALDGINVRAVSDRVFLLHLGGKVEVKGRVQVRTRDDLSLVYTPGVGRVSSAIADDNERSWALTMRRNSVAVVSNGTAVLGLGDIGPLAALPVMEGKALIFSEFAKINAIPLVIDARTPRQVIDTVVAIAPGFGGINLEDIAAPSCFEIERELRKRLEIPVFHDDQHGTAIVVLAGLRNAAAVVGRDLADLRVVINGAGAAGIATAHLLHVAGVHDVVLCDRQGVLTPDRADLNPEKRAMLEELGAPTCRGKLTDAMRGANVLIGLSGPKTVTVDMVRLMARPRIVFALANPVPEIDPLEAEGEVDVMATGRSDFPNQVNNSLAFPGVFRGLLDARARGVSKRIEIAAADALAAVVPANVRSTEYILPSMFDAAVVPAVAKAVTEATIAEGLGRARSASDDDAARPH